MHQPLIIADPRGILPEGRRYWMAPNSGGPVFASGVVATVFFGRSAPWIKRHLMLRDFGNDEGDVSPPKGPNGYYEWRLYDIERFAHALADNRQIDGRRLELVVLMVRTSAQLYDLIS